MRKTIRVTLLAAAATLVVVASGCGGGEQPSAGDSPNPGAGDAAVQQDSSSDGITTKDDVFGAACSQLPQDAGNAGSLDGMVDDPVATAAAGNPLLTKLVAAVQAANLVDTLNQTDASYTVFAPYDPAFEALGPALDQVLADPAALTRILTYHVVTTRLDRDSAIDLGSLPTVQGGTVQVAGSGQDMTVNGAKVLCGNIPTANATVFVIDTVLMPTG